MRNIHSHISHFFLVTLLFFFGIGKKFKKREDRRDPCTTNLPLFTAALMSIEQVKFSLVHSRNVPDKTFGPIHPKLELPLLQHDFVPHTVLPEAILSIYISWHFFHDNFLDKKTQTFCLCERIHCHSIPGLQNLATVWRTTLSCLMK